MDFNETPSAYEVKDMPSIFAPLHYPTDNTSMTALSDFGTESTLEPFNTGSLNCEWTKTFKTSFLYNTK
jgi:hypothetical protein